jgi:hypothetical protein
MTRSKTSLITFVGVIYLFVGLAGSIFPIMLLLSKPSVELLSPDSLLYAAVKLITVVPCFIIAYGWIRRKKWGLHLMIAYNALWLTYVTFALVSEMLR